jgi:hypothetical protein
MAVSVELGRAESIDKIDEITDDVVDSAFYDSSEEDTALNAPAYLRYLRNNPWWAS